jgi:pyridoxamine 5'-phosphate oxidase family protein
MGSAVFTDSEYRFLAARQQARMVSIGPGDAPQIHPVSYRVDTAGGWVEIGGPRLRDSQKYRNIRRDPRVTLIVDDQSAPLHGADVAGARTIEIHGMADLCERPAAGEGTDIIRIRPVRIESWNIERPGHDCRFVT